MKLGKTYKVNRCSYEKQTDKKVDFGKAVWIHPAGRFAALRFSDGLVECFFPEELEITR